MKKKLCLFVALTFALISCSSEETNPEKNNDVLVKTIAYTSPNENRLSIFTYDGNKIVSQTSNGLTDKYTYVGNLITKKESMQNDKLIYVMEYVYANGKLISQLEDHISQNDNEMLTDYKTVYTHNTNGTISYTMFTVINGVEVKSSSEGIITFENGNRTKFEYFNNGELRITYLYEYDTKNTPTKNVVGLNLLLDEEYLTSVNNLIKKTTVFSSSISTDSFVYTYDSNNFPTERKWFNIYNALSGVYNYTY